MRKRPAVELAMLGRADHLLANLDKCLETALEFKKNRTVLSVTRGGRLDVTSKAEVQAIGHTNFTDDLDDDIKGFMRRT
jgi:hypothetical protein